MGRISIAFLTLFVLSSVAVAVAGPEASLQDRAKILSAEMRRDAAALGPFLSKAPGTAERRLAIRALGRIGDDGNGPGILRDLLATETTDLALLLWAAGIAQVKELAEPIGLQLAKQLAAGHVENTAAAAHALGWTGAEGIAAQLTPLLKNEHAPIRKAALEGLTQVRGGDRTLLVAASALIDDPEASVREAAAFACWLLAARWRGAARKADEAWDGDLELAQSFLPLLADKQPSRRMAGIRVLGSLMPKSCSADGPFGAVFALVDDPETRVAQDAIGRLLTPREGAAVDAALIKALAHKDPKTRVLAAEALAKHGGEAAVTALEQAWGREQDARVLEALTVELVRLGKESYWDGLERRAKRAADPVVRQITDAQVLLVSKKPDALKKLFDWADPGASQRAGLHAATWMTILGGLEGRETEQLDEWLMGFLSGGYAVDREERHFVIASAVSLVGSNHRHALAPTLLEMLKRTWSGPPHDEIQQVTLHEEIRAALMGAFAELAGAEGCSVEIAATMRAAVIRHMRKDPSPWVRRAAREAALELELEDVPAIDEGQPNTWKGLPRAEEAIVGVDPEGSGAWLNEAEILEIADWIRANRPQLVFLTTAGPFVVELDAAAAPVHAVSLFNAVRNGVYSDTRFHRVVPNFVIQGGDPHGHGGGGGGWTVPDEISRNAYVRGALGMPKSARDDGGCQIFIMHTEYRPLDERYTCYGTVVKGMDVVDVIRVGDFIKKARVSLRGK